MKKVILAGLGIFVLCAIILTVWVAQVLSHLPDVSVLKHYRPAVATEVLDKDGNVLTEYYDRKFRIWVPISSLPDIVIQAVVTAEDDTFFEHQGINYKATWDALVHDWHKKRFARGGSTITQQMIKNVLLSKEKTISRKLREYVLARKAEEILTKRRILEIYLNEVEWGDDIYGIEAASRFYLDKHASELTAGEAALLAGMLPNPHYYNPFKRPEKAKDRQERVLANMLQAKLITSDEYDAAVKSLPALRQEGSGRFDFSGLQAANGRPSYQQALEQILLRLFGDPGLYRGGWTIKTNLDKKMQDDLDRLEDTLPDKANHTDEYEQLTIVKEDNQIRAIVCTPGKESTIRDQIGATGFLSPGYDVSTVSLDSITRDQIIFPTSPPGDSVPH
ncbi:MAG TPA: transglycosylase domain-containing protein [Nitrospirota bacterium]|nr:transglycosylase domain-containing protein [Nitrospirota bacterium]